VAGRQLIKARIGTDLRSPARESDQHDGRKCSFPEIPHCGANLSIGKTVDVFVCAYCGASVKVERTGNIIALRLLTDAMTSVQRGRDRTVAELAIRRLTDGRRASERALARAPLHRVANRPKIAAMVVTPLMLGEGCRNARREGRKKRPPSTGSPDSRPRLTTTARRCES
jgi:hypothetical protein